MQLLELIENAAEANQTHVAVDFQQIRRVGSAGLNKLIEMNCHARGGGLRLVLVDVNEKVREVFTLTRLERLFDFANRI